MRQANLQIWILKTYFWVEEKEDEFVGRGQDNGSGDDVLMKICLATTYSTVTSALTFPWKRNLAYTKKLVATKICKICKYCLEVPYAIKKVYCNYKLFKKNVFLLLPLVMSGSNLLHGYIRPHVPNSPGIFLCQPPFLLGSTGYLL